MRKIRVNRVVAIVAGVLLMPRIAASQGLTDTFSYSFGGNGGLVLTPTPPAPAHGYLKLQPGASSPTPAMLEVLGFRSSGVLKSETVIPSAPLISSGRLYVRIAGPVITGGAFTNPNNQAVTV